MVKKDKNFINLSFYKPPAELFFIKWLKKQLRTNGSYIYLYIFLSFFFYYLFQQQKINLIWKEGKNYVFYGVKNPFPSKKLWHEFNNSSIKEN